MQRIGQQLGNQVPLVHNLVEGGASPVEGSDELEALNYKIALYPVALLHAFVPMAEQVLRGIKERGHTRDQREHMVDLDYMNKLLGADELIARSEKYKG